MSTSGRKRKQQLKPRQDMHRSPLKRQSLDVKAEPLLASSYPLADYDCVDIKPDLTELQLQLELASNQKDETAKTELQHPAEEENQELEQQSDSDEDGYSEINFGTAQDIFCDDEVDDYDPDWSAQPTTPRLIFKFSSAPGQMGLRPQRKSTCPLYYFNQVLGNRTEFFGQFASGCNGRNNTIRASAEELETFMALSLLLCDMKLPNLSDYWNEQMFPGFLGFAPKMGEQRFLVLLQSLSFTRLHGATGTYAHKVVGEAGNLINFYNIRMSEIYGCGQQLVLNEPIVLWKGKFSYHNELPMKQRSNALILHLLSEHSGLILRMLPERLDQQQPARNSRQLVAQRCDQALQLLQAHGHRGHSVYACKYYGSYGLAHELAKLGTYCSGMLDRNRYGNSKALVYQQLAPNSIATRYATPLMMAKWRRRREKCVYFFSSDCLAIYAKEMSMQKINARPKLIQELDFQLRPSQSTRQQLTSCQPSCTGLNQQQQLSIFLLNLLVFNAYVLYVNNAQPSRGYSGVANDAIKLKTYAEFRMAIIKSLLKEDNVTIAPPVNNHRQDLQTKRATSQRFSTQPEPAELPKHELTLIYRNGKLARKNCRHCHKGGMLQFTKYMCNLCPDVPGLCLSPCFRLWHESQQQQHYSPST